MDIENILKKLGLGYSCTLQDYDNLTLEQMGNLTLAELDLFENFCLMKVRELRN